MNEYGKIKVNIENIMKERKLSRTKLTYLAFLQRKQLNKLLDGSATRIDFDVLARICHALQCAVSDILEYIPNQDN